MALALLKKRLFTLDKGQFLFWAPSFSKQEAVSENKMLPFEAASAGEGSSDSSPSRSIDLRAKVRPLAVGGCGSCSRRLFIDGVCPHACMSGCHDNRSH